MANKEVLTIKGYRKVGSKAGKKFTIYMAVGVKEDGTAEYATISFCKSAGEKIAELEKKLGKDFPNYFKFETPARLTNVKTKVLIAKDENDNPVVNEATGEVKTFENIKIYVEDFDNFESCDDVFAGVGVQATRFGR